MNLLIQRLSMTTNYAPFIKRRSLLSEAIKKAHPTKKGPVLLLAGFETERYPFRQDSSFYYLTGLEEPAVALVIEPQGNAILYVPQYGTSRNQWVSSIVDAAKEQLSQHGIADIQKLGQPCKGFSLAPSCLPGEYENLLTLLEKHVAQGEVIFTLYPQNTFSEQVLVLDRLLLTKPQLKAALVDISPLVDALRRTKSQQELEIMYEAIDCTMQALDGAAGRIEPGLFEYQVQAAIEFVFKESGASPAFPSIVASGKNSTVLHYTKNNRQMNKGDLVVIDIGAEIDYYCADLSRTFPVSGMFTNRQRDIYNIVLQTQQYIETLAKPGYWISHKDHPEKSLNHLARAYLKEQGYDKYFHHGIGHFLGLDVHDVGNYAEPLKEGDVITIEPGIYIPEESLGVRIEDNYWITSQGAVCMSEEFPKDSYEIEELMAQEEENDFD